MFLNGVLWLSHSLLQLHLPRAIFFNFLGLGVMCWLFSISSSPIIVFSLPCSVPQVVASIQCIWHFLIFWTPVEFGQLESPEGDGKSGKKERPGYLFSPSPPFPFPAPMHQSSSLSHCGSDSAYDTAWQPQLPLGCNNTVTSLVLQLSLLLVPAGWWVPHQPLWVPFPLVTPL